jgi:hypothetical protein
MVPKHVLRLGAWLVLVLGMGACDLLGPDDPKGPGSFEVRLLSPNGAEGGAVLELAGGVGLGTVSPIGGEVLYDHRQGVSLVAVVLEEPGTVRFNVRTDDVGRLPEARVIQVSDENDQLRSSVSGYEVSFSWEKDSSKKGKAPG